MTFRHYRPRSALAVVAIMLVSFWTRVLGKKLLLSLTGLSTLVALALIVLKV